MNELAYIGTELHERGTLVRHADELRGRRIKWVQWLREPTREEARIVEVAIATSQGMVIPFVEQKGDAI